MRHSIESLIGRINAMHDLAVQVHRLRNQYSEMGHQQYDKQACQSLIDQIQSMALTIAKDKEGDDIVTEMEYKKQLTVTPCCVSMVLYYYKDAHV